MKGTLTTAEKELLISLLSKLSRRADESVPASRVPLYLMYDLVGHIEKKEAIALSKQFRFVNFDEARNCCVIVADNPEQASLRVAAVAYLYKQEGLVRAWRDELLPIVAVTDFERSNVLGCIERAMARPFALSTFAVHLNPFTEDGMLWVGQRSFKKAIGPGYWDNCAAGMVPIGETFVNAMARESWEEAGIEEGSLSYTYLSRHLISRAVTEGWMFEHTIIFDALVPFDFEPHNIDGEVNKFELLTEQQVIERVSRGLFTFESSLSVLLSIAARNGLSAELETYKSLH